MQSDEQQELNFLAFSRDFVGPAERDFEAAGALERWPLFGECARATLIEAAHWLSLGSAVGYFPREGSIFAIKSMVSNPELNVPRFLAEWGHIMNPFLRNQWESWIAAARSIDTEIFFGPGDDINALFQSVLSEATRFSRSKMARAFCVLINFYGRDELYSNLADKPVFLEELSRALESEAGFDPISGEPFVPAAFVGFGHFVSYLSYVQEKFNSSRDGESAANFLELKKLLRGVARIQSWRFYGISSGSLAATATRAAVSAAIARAYSLSASQMAELSDLTWDLVTYWERNSMEVSGSTQLV